MKLVALALLSLLAVGPGCAFINPENTPLVNWASEGLVGKDPGLGQTLLFSPLAITLGLVDVIVVHPARMIDDAWLDARGWVWDKPSGGSATKAFFFLPKVAFTPVAFLAPWIAKSFYDLRGSEMDENPERRRKELQQELNRARIRANFWKARVRALEKEIQAIPSPPR